MTSLKTQLTTWLIGLFTVMALLTAGISFSRTRDDMNRFLDSQLRLVAGSVHTGSMFQMMDDRSQKEGEPDSEPGFLMQSWLVKERRLNTSNSKIDLPIKDATGFSNIDWRGHKWRSYTIVYPDRTVQVSQADSVRVAIARKAALQSLLPIIGLIPLVWLIITGVVSRVFKPLEAATHAIRERDLASNEAIPSAHLPREVAPFVGAMNGLVSRLQEAVEIQRQFVADAAHELRTPLTALQLQVDGIAPVRIDADGASRLASLRSSIQRATHLVNQLLKLARYESRLGFDRGPLDMAGLVKSSIAEFIPTAERRDIDLGLVHEEAAWVVGNCDALRILLNNLLDNAVRYTPDGGRIDVGLSGSASTVTVAIEDSGPGIPESLLAHVFDRFFRVSRHESEGSGIGLAIAKAIAERESASLALANRPDGAGLIATVSFERFVPDSSS